MEEIRQLFEWHQSGIRAAMATVIQTWGSSPRPVGSVLAISEKGDIVGSVSGGCVESEVIAACQTSIATGESKFLDFKQISEREVWESGLTCGGKIQVFVEPSPFDSQRNLWNFLVQRFNDGQECRLLRNLSTGEDVDVSVDSTGRFTDEMTKKISSSEDSFAFEVSDEEWFFLFLKQPINLIVIGASHISLPLFRIADSMRMRTTLVEPRSQLTEPSRFSTQPGRIVCGWPEDAWDSIICNDTTCVITLSHDDKIDVPALALALRSNARYIGALGSKATQLVRRAKLQEMGFEDSEIDRIHGPIGISIGAKSPEEIALSIVAEIIQEFRIGN